MSSEAGERLRALVVAGYPAVRAGLIAMLAFEVDIEPIDESAVDHLDPDVVVIDAGSLSENAIDDVAARYPAIPMVLIGAELGTVDSAFFASPGGYVPSDIDSAALAATVRAVAQGLTVIAPGLVATGNGTSSSDSHDAGLLTPREREVLELIADGLPNKAIARELGISEHTAKFHVGSVLGKLGASSRAEAVTLATRRGLLTV